MIARRAGAAAALAALALCAPAARAAPEPDPKPAAPPPAVAPAPATIKPPPAPAAKALSTPAAKPVQASHGPPLAGGPQAPRRGPCDRLDAAEIPACADEAQRRGRPDPGPAAGPAEVPHKPAVAATQRPTAKAAPKAAAPKSKPAPKPALPAFILAHPLLAGGAGGGLVLLIALGAWALLARDRSRPAVASGPKGAAPTPFRRDLVLVDPQGQGRRLAGAALSPFAWAGADGHDHLRLEGDGVAGRHVQFWVAEGRLMVRKASAEPVFLNDRLLKDETAEVVSTGDRLQLGRAGFTILID